MSAPGGSVSSVPQAAALNVVLVEPEIPQNTGNVARTCAATGASLHLVRPLGFSTDDRHLKRAGLDYWDKLDIHYHDSIAAFMGEAARAPGAQFWLLSTKGARSYAEIRFGAPCYLVFGRETSGLPEWFIREHADRCFRIPMRPAIRSLNLSNAVAVVVYEALRQAGFGGLQREGSLASMR